MIPTPGVGVQVLSRHIRLCAFDGTQVGLFLLYTKLFAILYFLKLLWCCSGKQVKEDILCSFFWFIFYSRLLLEQVYML